MPIKASSLLSRTQGVVYSNMRVRCQFPEGKFFAKSGVHEYTSISKHATLRSRPAHSERLIHRSAWRNCLENSRKRLDRTSLATRGGRSRLLGSLLVAFVAPIRDLSRISKQFRKRNFAKFAGTEFWEVATVFSHSPGRATKE